MKRFLAVSLIVLIGLLFLRVNVYAEEQKNQQLFGDFYAYIGAARFYTPVHNFFPQGGITEGLIIQLKEWRLFTESNVLVDGENEEEEKTEFQLSFNWMPLRTLGTITDKQGRHYLWLAGLYLGLGPCCVYTQQNKGPERFKFRIGTKFVFTCLFLDLSIDYFLPAGKFFPYVSIGAILY